MNSEEYQRGTSESARGPTHGFALTFPTLVLSAAVLSVGLFFLTRVEPRPSTAGLAQFLSQGPSTGMWETRRLYSQRRAYFAPLPGDPGRILMAPVPGSEVSTGCATCTSACSYTRPQVMQFVFDAPAGLFFRNYRMIKPPETTTLTTGRAAYVAVWAPRHRDGKLSERNVWFDPKTGVVLQIEDFSRSGHLVRRARKLTDDTGEFDPKDFDPKDGPVCCADCPSDWLTEEEQLADVADDSGLRILRPRNLPEGFRFVRATYREVPLPGRATGDDEEDEDADERVARVVTLLYSDGMALISIGIARTPDMDALERAFAQMQKVAEAQPRAGGACPSLPARPKRIPVRGTTIRVRSDKCRTVLRRDDERGISVTLLGRNELSVDEYLDVIAELEEFIPPVDPDDEDD